MGNVWGLIGVRVVVEWILSPFYIKDSLLASDTNWIVNYTSYHLARLHTVMVKPESGPGYR